MLKIKREERYILVFLFDIEIIYGSCSEACAVCDACSS